MDICINRATLPPITTTADVIIAAHKAGFKQIEISARRLKEVFVDDSHGKSQLEARYLIEGRKILSVHGGWSLRLHWEREKFERSLHQAELEMAFVAGLGSRSGALVLHRQHPAHSTKCLEYEELVCRIRKVAEVANKYSINLVVEFNGLQSNDLHDCVPSTLPETVELIKNVNRLNAGVLLDSYHWHASHGTLADINDIPSEMPIFVHINDAPNIDIQMLEDSMRLLPGDGVIDLNGFLGALSKRGYDGPVSVELKNPVLHSMEPTAAAVQAYTAVRRLFKKLGEE